ncbi:MAG: glycosyltransferase, partial [Campylobacterales bacterium]|nr:glycosyltransferase [Campylobacterales bacterium]
MLIKHISVVVIVKNSEKTIKRTLDSLTSFDDVVVYDNGSTDTTMQ